MDIFSKIAAGEIPSYKVAADDEFYAFLYQQFAKRVALAIKKAFPCKKVAQVVLGLEVAHAHIHLIPMQTEQDADFRREKLKLSEEEFKEIAAKIQQEFV